MKSSIMKETCGTSVRLSVLGELVGTGNTLAADIAEAVADPGVTEVIVDLEAVTFLDSGGIHILVTGEHSAARTGVAYAIVNPRDHVLRVLTCAGILPPVDTDRIDS